MKKWHGCLLAWAIAGSSAQAATVGIEGVFYPSIQAAVNAATNGDVINLSTGVFFEVLNVSGKNLVLEGGYNEALTARPGGYTAIDGSPAFASALWFQDSSSRVDRVNLVHGTNWFGGGCLLNRSWVEFTNACFSSNAAVFGGGLFVDEFSYAKLGGASRVFTNFAWAFVVPGGGGGVYVKGRVDIVHEDADIWGNTVLDGNGGGIFVEANGYLRLYQGDVYRNVAISGAVSVASGGGGIAAQSAFLETGDGAEVYGNRADYGGGLNLVLCTAHLGRARSADFRVHGNAAAFFGGGGSTPRAASSIRSGACGQRMSRRWTAAACSFPIRRSGAIPTA